METQPTLPFRHFDRYVVEGFSQRLQHFTRAVRRPGAIWRRLSWEHGAWAPGAELRRGREPEIHVLVRFDGQPAWHVKPTNRAGGLYIFKDPLGAWKNPSKTKGHKLDVVADEVELRILFFWPEGCYGGSRATGFFDTWKVAPRLRSLVLEYQERGGVLHHEEFVR